MKYIVGIDYGTKFCGLARADADSPVKIASPWDLIKREELENFIISHKKDIDLVVLGKSLNLKGGENKVQKEIDVFVEFLKEQGLKVALVDERFSSQAALAEKRLLERKQKSRKANKKERLDSAAASIILQSYLDSLV